MLEFKVSVIIPVYNAEKYLRKAVESAVNLPEVGEVILIEDNSPDDALRLCVDLKGEYENVKLYRHPNGENRGASESRNLGILRANFDYIAFLDADDWYLPNRFQKEKELFKRKEVDGVYGATGFYEEGKGLIEGKLTTVKKMVPPEDLMYYILTHHDSFTTNSISIRKCLFDRIGFFNPTLTLHQDTHLWYKMIFKGNLFAGTIDEPIAIRRVHNENRITHSNRNSKGKFHRVIYLEFRNYSGVSRKVMKILFNRYIHSFGTNKIQIYKQYLLHFIKDPLLLKYYL